MGPWPRSLDSSNEEDFIKLMMSLNLNEELLTSEYEELIPFIYLQYNRNEVGMKTIVWLRIF